MALNVATSTHVLVSVKAANTGARVVGGTSEAHALCSHPTHTEALTRRGSHAHAFEARMAHAARASPRSAHHTPTFCPAPTRPCLRVLLRLAHHTTTHSASASAHPPQPHA